jgi:uncharacterized protein YjeT (DUF2065 family)
MFLTELSEWQWLGALCARLAVGLLFFLSGRGKLFVPERREQMRETLVAARVPFASLNAIFASTVEFVFGLLLILGGADAAGVPHAWRRNDRGHRHVRDQKYQSAINTWLALRIFVPA